MKNIIKLLSIILLFSITACNEYLGKIPKGIRVPETMEDFGALLQDEYGVHRASYLQANILRNDVFQTSSTLNYYPLYKANYFWDEAADRITLNNADETTYYAAYAAINTCNLVIENILTSTGGTAPEKQRILAEAKFIRASNYFLLVNFYAETYDATTASTKLAVPLITSSAVGAAYTQVTIQELYDFILKDLNEALPNLSAKAPTIIEPGKGAGYAMLAKVYLQMDRYNEALNAANEALAQNSTLFDWVAFYNANKTILEAPGNYTRASSPMGYTFVENYYFSHGSNSYATAEAQLRVDRAERFETGDAALASRWKKRTVAADTYYYAMTTGFLNYSGITTTEVYLIKAECLARANDISGAMTALNAVRAKRIFPTNYQPLTAANTIAAVKLINKTKEDAMILTLTPFADTRRLNKDSNYARTLTKTENGSNYSLSPTSHLWIMPFPMGAIKNPGNGTITQNAIR